MKKPTSSSKRRVGKMPEMGMGYGGETYGRMEGKPRAQNAQEMPRTVKPYRPHENYIVKNTMYIHGENFYVLNDEMEQFMAGAIQRGKMRRAQQLCKHEFGPWGTYDGDTAMRSCPKCGKKDYK